MRRDAVTLARGGCPPPPVMLLLLGAWAAAATGGAWASPARSPADFSPSSAPAAAATADTPTSDVTVSLLGPEVPDFIKPCQRGDPQINSCLRDSFNTYLHRGAAGVPSMGLPTFDPLQIPLLNLSVAVPGNMTLTLLLQDVNVRGFSKGNVVAVRVNLAEQKVEVAGRAQRLELDGVFTSQGAVLSFPLSAQGVFSVNMTEVSAAWVVYFTEKPITPGGPNHFVIDHLEMDFAPVDVSYHFGDTLDDNNLLGEAMNEFLNANAHEVLGDAKARAAALLGEAMGQAASAVLDAFPADRLLLPPEATQR